MAAPSVLSTLGVYYPASTGEDYNAWNNPSNAFSDNGSYADSDASNEQQDFYDFDIASFPAGATLVGIVVEIQAKQNTFNTADLDVDLSWNGGANYTSAQQILNIPTSDTDYSLGGLWGRTWSESEFSNADFRVRLTSRNIAGPSWPISVDYIRIKLIFLGGTTKVYDSFTVESDTSLAFHNPDIGSTFSWGEFQDFGGKDILCIAATDTARINSTGLSDGSHYKNSSAIGSADYNVLLKMSAVDLSGDDTMYVFGRVQDASNFYTIEFSGDYHVRLFKMVSGSWTELGLYDPSGDDYAIGDIWELAMKGTAITVYRNGAQVIDVTDSAHAAEGDAGFGFGRFRNSGDDADTAWQIDDFYIKTALTTSTKTHTTDAALIVQQTKSHTTDAFLSAILLTSHTTDAYLSTIRLVQHTTDASLLSALTVSHGTDAFLLAVHIVQQSTDAFLSTVQNLQHSTDAFSIVVSNKTHSTDAFLRITVQKLHFTDALLLAVQLRAHTTDALLRATESVVHQTDALLRATLMRGHDTDALLQAVQTAEHATDALLRVTLAVQHGTDSLLKATITREHGTDTLLRKAQQIAYNTDTFLQNQSTPSHSTDAFLSPASGAIAGKFLGEFFLGLNDIFAMVEADISDVRESMDADANDVRVHALLSFNDVICAYALAPNDAGEQESEL